MPLVHVPRAELPLRTDTLHVLRLLGLDASQLLCLGDDVDLARAPGLALTLIDHNALAAPLRALTPAVVAVLDHHVVR